MCDFRNDIRDLPAYKKAMNLFDENKPYTTVNIKGGTFRYQNLSKIEFIGRVKYPPIEDPEGLVPYYLKWHSLEEQPIHSFASIDALIQDITQTIDRWCHEVNSYLKTDETIHVRYTHDFIFRKQTICDYSKCTPWSDPNIEARHLAYLALHELASNDEIDLENFEVIDDEYIEYQ